MHGSTPALLLEEVGSAAVTRYEAFSMCFHNILAMFDIFEQIVDAVEFAESMEFTL